MSVELSSLINEFVGLGRKDAIAIRNADGSYRLTRRIADVPRGMIDAHLSGRQSLGIYPVTGSMTSLGVIDLDDHEGSGDPDLMKEKATLAYRALVERGCKPLVVRSGGGRGIHIWVIYETPQSARAVRFLLNEALVAAGLKQGTTGVSEGTAEVFPKQDQVEEGGFGSLIALPFSRASLPLDPQTMEPISLAVYTAPKIKELFSENLVTRDDLPPQDKHIEKSPPLPGDEEEAGAALTHVSADDYHVWIRFGLALKHAFGERGFPIWLEWSKRSPKFDTEAKCSKVWTGLKPTGQVGLGTIFHVAQGLRWNGPSNPMIREMNGRFGILTHGNKTLIVLKNGDRRPDDEFATLGVQPFFDRLAAEPMMVLDANGSPVPTNKARIWFKHALAAHYHRLTFDPSLDPGHNGKDWNLWRGFAYSPIPGSWDRLKDHLFQNVCRGDANIMDWFLNWLAFGVQRRGDIPGTVPVLLGPPGVGKGFLANAYGALWGAHYAAVTHHDHVFGRFNNHLLARRFVFIDEGLFGGNRKEAGVMKGRVTEPYLIFEQKGVDPIKMPNRAMFMVASNEASVVPADAGDRRWMVMSVGSARREDHQYFGEIQKELTDGGYSAMLFDLLHRDISKGPNPRQTIKGMDLSLQILRAQPAHIQYLHRILDEGRLPQNRYSAPNTTTIKALHREMREQHPEARHMNDNALGRYLQSVLPDILTAQNGRFYASVRDGSAEIERSTRYTFPPLQQARLSFESSIGSPVPWLNRIADWIGDDDGSPI
jgi:hypothetical protein